MRHTLVIGAALVLGLAAWKAHSSEGAAKPERPPAARDASPRPGPEALAAPQARITLEGEKATSGVSGVTAVPAPAAPAPARSARLDRAQVQTLGLMERELGLSSDQRRQVEAIFLDRQVEVDAYHREVKASGVFSQKSYSLRITDLRLRHYARMEACLDSRQARRFHELLHSGTFGDGIAFEIDPNLVEVD